MLDGFLIALAIGPRMISPEEFFAHVWGTDDGTQPDWDGETQQRYVQELIARIVEAITRRKQAGAAHVPIGLDGTDAAEAGEAAADWVDGFLFATELLEDDWQPLFDAPEGLEDTLAIQALLPDDTEYFEREATTKERGEIIARLPEILRRIANFWLSPEKAYPRRQPVRVEKVGRNDPCPCGSGQKYKKCCALKPPPVMH